MKSEKTLTSKVYEQIGKQVLLKIGESTKEDVDLTVKLCIDRRRLVALAGKCGARLTWGYDSKAKKFRFYIQSLKAYRDRQRKKIELSLFV